jgi:aryl carrier-like protein
MRARTFDSPPKIISFRPNLNGLRIASKKSILWPCHAFKVSVPSRRKKDINIFEKTILKLCATESSNTRKLADITCLDNEIVMFIKHRLHQQDLLTDRFELNENAKTLLDEWNKGQQDYIAATVYVDLIGGNLMPVVVAESPGYEKVIDHGDSNGYIRFKIGSAGKGNKITALQLLPERSNMAAKPTSNEVAKTIKAFRRLHKRYSLLTENRIGRPSFYLGSDAITVEQEPELVFLNCIVIIQSGNPDFLITDAFGFGFSNTFKESLYRKAKSDNKIDNWLIRLKENGLVKNPIKSEVKDSEGENNVPAGFSHELHKYPEIQNRLRRAESRLNKAKSLEVNSTSHEKEKKRLISEFVKGLYDALEWTFRQVVFENPVDHWEQIFASGTYKNNASLLHQLAAKIGFSVSGLGSSILNVKPGQIKAYSNGTVELQPLIALAIAGASHDAIHPLNNLVHKGGDCLTFIANLKKLRDTAAHGGKLNYAELMQATAYWCTECDKAFDLIDTPDQCPDCGQKVLKIYTTILDDYRKRTHHIIFNLYPHLQGKSGEISQHITAELKDIDQLRLNARIEIDKYFGLSLVQLMPRSLSEDLMKIELLWDDIKKGTGCVQTYINTLASVLQISLFNSYHDLNRLNGKLSNLTVTALEKANEAEFHLIDRQLPERIETTNKNRVKSACSGNNSTLGANIIAFLILMSEDRLKYISKHIPDFLILVANIIELRGHGNNPQHKLSDDELHSLKTDAFKIIKMLMEI